MTQFSIRTFSDKSLKINFILQAAREGNLKVIKRYISSVHFKRKLEKVAKGGKNPIDTPDSEGFTALHYAARYNNIDVMELLIEHGAGRNFTFLIFNRWAPDSNTFFIA